MFMPQLPKDLHFPLNYSISAGESWFSAFSTPVSQGSPFGTRKGGIMPPGWTGITMLCNTELSLGLNISAPAQTQGSLCA